MEPSRRWLWLAGLLFVVLGINEALRIWWRFDMLERLLALLLALTIWAFINGRWIFAYYYALRSAWLTGKLPLEAPLAEGEGLLVVAPHPDDETLAAAGQIDLALRRGARVRIVWLTSGDGFDLASGKAAPPQEEMRRLALKRMAEARRAAEILGVAEAEQVFLGYPDLGLLRVFSSHYYLPYTSPHTGLDSVSYPGCRSLGAPYTGESLEADLAAAIEEFAPSRVLVPSPLDAHPDHQAAAFVTMRVMGKMRRQQALRYYIVHGGYEYPLPKGLHPHLLLYPPPRGRRLPWLQTALDEEAQEKKLAAARAHASQTRLIGKFMLAFVRRSELSSRLPIPLRELPDELRQLD